MAGLPATQTKSSSPDLSKGEQRFVELLAKGHRPPDIAKAAYPNDPRARKNLRRKLWRRVKQDPRISNALAEQARAELVMGVAPASERLAKRAKRLGKAQDVKMLYEASGFHNSRVQHEHSGDITISLDIPRPVRVDPEDVDVQDAEVVDD